MILMASSSTRSRHARGDRIDLTGVFAMVACSYCAKKSLPCKLSSLSRKCGNCERFGIVKCVPKEVPPPDFSRIDREMDKLEKSEKETEDLLTADLAAVEAVYARVRARHAKLARLRKQKRLLKEKEQVMFDRGIEDVEDLEALEALERLNSEIASVNPDADPLAQVVDWSLLWDSPVDVANTAEASAGSLRGWFLVPMCFRFLGTLTI